MGTQGKSLALTGIVALNRALQQIELRLFSNGGDAQLEAISISVNQPAVSGASQ
ncbi:hypothetical protein D3C78_1761480 [compost metagenome]